MQKILRNKFVLPVLVLAIVGIAGVMYTIANLGPTNAHAQTATVKNSVKELPDAETQDDQVSPKPSTAIQQLDDKNENDKADQGSRTEVEDGK